MEVRTLAKVLTELANTEYAYSRMIFVGKDFDLATTFRLQRIKDGVFVVPGDISAVYVEV